MSHLHFIGGEKGGVGKSLVARVLAQYFIDRERPFVGFDADPSHGALMRFYADYTSPVRTDQYDSLDRIVETAVAQPESDVLVDLAAQTQDALLHWIEESNLLELASEMDLPLTYWHVMDTGRDSVDLLRKLLDTVGGRLDLVLVKNEVRGGDFQVLDASAELKRALTMGAKVITLRRLQDSTMQKIDAHSSSFWAVTHSSSPSQVGLLERQRIKSWLNRTYAEFERIGV
ncbi:mobilization protein [Pigmentiphaga litoralis]|uniref:nucleotide-binding protein n=1 Tax=Pigmentiphaga litoralis TaxID=516702 RepID=UPI003B432EB2